MKCEFVVNPAKAGAGRAGQGAAPLAFMFATGIENGAPTIQGGRVRRDQMAELGHCGRWREDLAPVRELGIDVLRYGPQIYNTLTGPGRHNWRFADETFAEIRRLGITPIVDLCRLGVPTGPATSRTRTFPRCSPTRPAPLPAASHACSAIPP